MLPPKHSDHAIWFVIFVILFFVVGSFIFIQYEIAQIKSREVNIVQPIVETTTLPAAETPSPTPVVATSIISPTPTPKTVVVTTSPPVQTQNKVTYVPLTGGNTQNTDWTNVSGSQFTLNIGDYGANAYAIWDANLRVDNANGETFARLFDTTHGIAVNGSEINITDTSMSTDIISGALSFWQGNNTYVVQIKSLNSSIAFIDSGRIKINY